MREPFEINELDDIGKILRILRGNFQNRLTLKVESAPSKRKRDILLWLNSSNSSENETGDNLENLPAKTNDNFTSLFCLIFAHPDTKTMRLIQKRREYFKSRTGETWDLVLPGYFNASEQIDTAGSFKIASASTSSWGFDANAFNSLRKFIEIKSDFRWRYSGNADIVLINCYITDTGEPLFDWESTLSADIESSICKSSKLSIAEIVELISTDIEKNAEDESYGLELLFKERSTSNSGFKDNLKTVILGILSSLIFEFGKSSL